MKDVEEVATRSRFTMREYFEVYEIINGRVRTGKFLGLFTLDDDARIMAKGKGRHGQNGRVKKVIGVLDHSSGLVYALQDKQGVIPDGTLMKERALAKLTEAEKQALGVS